MTVMRHLICNYYYYYSIYLNVHLTFLSSKLIIHCKMSMIGKLEKIWNIGILEYWNIVMSNVND